MCYCKWFIPGSQGCRSPSGAGCGKGVMGRAWCWFTTDRKGRAKYFLTRVGLFACLCAFGDQFRCLFSGVWGSGRAQQLRNWLDAEVDKSGRGNWPIIDCWLYRIGKSFVWWRDKSYQRWLVVVQLVYVYCLESVFGLWLIRHLWIFVRLFWPRLGLLDASATEAPHTAFRMLFSNFLAGKSAPVGPDLNGIGPNCSLVFRSVMLCSVCIRLSRLH